MLARANDDERGPDADADGNSGAGAIVRPWQLSFDTNDDFVFCRSAIDASGLSISCLTAAVNHRALSQRQTSEGETRQTSEGDCSLPGSLGYAQRIMF